ncbi:MAG: beta-propeller fold lactonase family protein [Nitrososphaera sp.]|jgi:6-phosphogluconolactonase (cycloisomerase 2 family)
MNKMRFLSVVFAAALLSLVVSGTGRFAAAETSNSAAAGAVFTMTNSASGNSIVAYDRAANGSISIAGTFPTGGSGTGAGLGSQGSITTADNGHWLLAVNAGSNEISVFKLTKNPALSLTLTDKVSSNGIRPISITASGNVVYVLDNGTTSAGNIAGYHLESGKLFAIPHSIKPLSGVAAAAQISFNPQGNLLIVTEKSTNTIDTYTVDPKGVASGPVLNTSRGITPFGFAVDNRGHIVVSEAVSGALSSYSVSKSGALTTISGSVTDGYAAACWVVITSDDKIAFTTNAHSNTISSYSIAGNGSLSLLQGLSASTDAAPTDMALSHGSKYLYVVDSGTSEIQAFKVHSDGTLGLIQTVGSVKGIVGLAAAN